VTGKPFNELYVGDVIADMYHGMRPLEERFRVVSHIRWDEPRPIKATHTGYAEHAFFNYIQEFLTDTMYLNKMLVVIGFDDNAPGSEIRLVCAYCYDGRRSGIIVLADKKGS
jgi:hypothetical protein